VDSGQGCRAATARLHGTTKKIPAEQFELEKPFLRPVPQTKKSVTPSVTRLVHKDNTILFHGCRYTLPIGTYRAGRDVSLEVEDGLLKIYDAIDPVLLAEHPVSNEKGKLVRNKNHGRDYSGPLDAIQKQLFEKMLSLPEAQIYLQQVRRLKSRYARDQFGLIERTVDEYPPITWQESLAYCVTNSLYSATEFREATIYFNEIGRQEKVALEANLKIILLPTVKPEKRPLSVYSDAAKRGVDKQ